MVRFLTQSSVLLLLSSAKQCKFAVQERASQPLYLYIQEKASQPLSNSELQLPTRREQFGYSDKSIVHL